jgi:leader peptidase (prepilin peptidase)/N-methyltransferase
VLVEEISPLLVRVTWFVWGALWGSFFNVAIHRWPREMSVVSPPSHCPSCGAPVPAWRNLPILAYLLQRGRAACCGAKLTPRYLVVEVLSACLAVAVAERFVIGSAPDRDLLEASLEALVWFAFVGGLVIATFVDLEHMQIPDEVSLGGAALGLATVTVRSEVDVTSIAIGAGAAYLVMVLVPVWGWERLTGQRGMGEGDAKLLLCIGTFVGWQGVLFVIAAASLQGTLGWLAQLAWRARTSPPDAPRTGGEATSASAEPRDPDAGEEEDVVEAEGPRGARAELDVDLPGKIVAKARLESDRVRLVVRYRLDPGAPDAPHVRFGPFLSLAALEFLFFGNRIIAWYVETVFVTD